jgi:methyl-accepting chemotaxis protein
MFPHSFTGQVAQRMAIWGAALSFLLLLYVAIEITDASRIAQIAADRQIATAATLDYLDRDARAAGDDIIQHTRVLVESIAATNARDASCTATHSQNRLLITLLAAFVIGQILVLEYRFLVRPVMAMATALHAGADTARAHVAAFVHRGDEIGRLAQALCGHFSMVERQRTAASAEQAALSERLARQDALRRESVVFQDSIAQVLQHLKEHAGQMSAASENLASMSTEADDRAAASAQSTERVSAHVDVMASSIQDIAAAMTSVTQGAEKTSDVAASARQAVEIAGEDATALMASARAIEEVIALIEHVARQTNLLALNAAIEAARAGEMGRGFGVVAQEVKQLATQTARATEDVRDGLRGVTAASVRIVERVGTLAQSIDRMAGAAGDIAESIRRQDANSQAIASNTMRTADDVRDVAANVKGVAGVISRTRQAADVATRVSTDLGRQASSLGAAVERFMATTKEIAA